MGFLSRLIGREERAGNPLENPTVPVSASADELMAFFGVARGSAQLPHVTIDRALALPAFGAGVRFLSRALASMPLHAYKSVKGETKRTDGDLQMLVNEAPNDEWTAFEARRYFWQQVFTGGRGLFWIERLGPSTGSAPARPRALWPMDPTLTNVVRRGARKFYRFGANEYPAADVIDVTFMLKVDQINVYSPVYDNKDTIALAIAMNEFAGTFFAGGGVPPLALQGPLPSGPEAFKRAQADIQRAVDNAKKSGAPFFGMPPGHELKAIGIDPAKGQMTAARLFQLQECARILGLPPVFVQDLSTGTLANTEQQDLQLVKHLIAHWCTALEQEMNLKLFGQRRRAQYVEHNLDALLRSDLKSRIEALARGVHSGLLMPDEGRALENRPPDPSGAGARLYMQAGTVPLGTQPTQTPPPREEEAPEEEREPEAPPPPRDNGEDDDDEAGDE